MMIAFVGLCRLFTALTPKEGYQRSLLGRRLCSGCWRLLSFRSCLKVNLDSAFDRCATCLQQFDGALSIHAARILNKQYRSLFYTVI